MIRVGVNIKSESASRHPSVWVKARVRLKGKLRFVTRVVSVVSDDYISEDETSKLM